MPDLRYEKELWKSGKEYVAGIDEVGRGCIAGPLFAAAVVFPKDIEKRFDSRVSINDSKKLSHKKRLIANDWIQKNAAAWGIGVIDNTEIDKLGIVKAANKAFKISTNIVNNYLNNSLKFLLIDAFYISHFQGFPVGSGKITGKGKQMAIIKGDSISLSIAAASIIAKVARDSYMNRVSDDDKYMKYGWRQNKGYATLQHRLALKEFGITNLHRKSFLKGY